jgi:hypothetical protein
MAKARIKRAVDVDAGTVTFTELATAESFAADLRVLYGDLWDSMSETQKRLVLHGANAKFGDSASDPAEPAIPQIKTTYDNVVGGVWSARGEGSGEPRMTDLPVAVFNVMSREGQDVTQAAVTEAVANWDDDKKKAVRADPRVKAEIDRLREDRAREKRKASEKAAKAAAGSPLTL